MNFSGGEPFLHPEIIEIVNYTHNLGTTTTLYTSGVVGEGDKR